MRAPNASGLSAAGSEPAGVCRPGQSLPNGVGLYADTPVRPGPAEGGGGLYADSSGPLLLLLLLPLLLPLPPPPLLLPHPLRPLPQRRRHIARQPSSTTLCPS